jgi:hypothetical protein
MPVRACKRVLADTLVALRLRTIYLFETLRLVRILRDPMQEQNRLLSRILRKNRDTTFGREHGFSDIVSYDDYRTRVPVADFEVLRPYIEAEIKHAELALTAAPPVQYVRTSGSTGQPKDVPMTAEHLRMLRGIHQMAVSCQHRVCPEAFAGSILAIVSPRHEGMLANNRPFGSASGIVSGNTPQLVREKFVLPQEVLTITDSRIKYLLILRLAVARSDVTYIGSANPTTLLTLIRLYIEHQDALIDDVRKGGFFLDDQLTEGVRVAIRNRLRALPRRADELARLQQRLVEPKVSDLWPALRGVMVWTCGSAGVAAAALRRELSPETRILELGYLSSEFRGTITLGRRPGSGLPTLGAHFFEFVERDRWDRGEPEFLTLDRLRKGVDYYIIVTTPSGLYRYFINDVVRVTGILHRTPLLKFMQKGKGVTNITGEKLYETQVLMAVQAEVASCGRVAKYLVMLADEDTRVYRLYIEMDSESCSAKDFAAAVDMRLQALNVEYAAKRESGRLGHLLCFWLVPQTSDAYKRFCVERGQREGQFKPPALAYAREMEFDLEAHVHISCARC